MPDPMKHDDDITIFNSFIQRQRLYQFLVGINDNLDKERRDLLNQDPLSTLDKAYANIRRKTNWRGIMTNASSSKTNPLEIGSGLMVKHRLNYTWFRRETMDKSHLTYVHMWPPILTLKLQMVIVFVWIVNAQVLFHLLSNKKGLVIPNLSYKLLSISQLTKGT